MGNEAECREKWLREKSRCFCFVRVFKGFSKNMRYWGGTKAMARGEFVSETIVGFLVKAQWEGDT